MCADKKFLISAQAYAELTENAMDAVVVIVARSEEIVAFNRAAEIMFGYAREEVLGKPLGILMAERYRDKHHKHVRGFVTDNKTIRSMHHAPNPVFGAMRKDGTEFPVEAQLSKAMDPNYGLLLGAALRDVTERVEAKKRENEFFGRFNHELRTPLNAILGYIEILRDPQMWLQTPDEKKLLFLERGSQAGRHLLGLINDLLDAGKVLSGDVVYHTEMPYPIHQTVLSAMQMLEPKTHGRDLVCVCTTSDLSILLTLDERRVSQLIRILIDNAIKYTERGVVSVSYGREDKRVWISVEDTGIGIAPENLQRIFEAYAQVGPKSIEGVGLGLTVGRDIARHMGGDIQVESEFGNGSKFTLYLPCLDAPP